MNRAYIFNMFYFLPLKYNSAIVHNSQIFDRNIGITLWKTLQ